MVQELAYSNLPVVTLDHAFNNRTAVLSDNMNGMEALVRYVYAKGTAASPISTATRPR